MANNKMVVESKSSDIGNFIVGRYLPIREKRQIGPFTFVDHMGPVKIETGSYFDVDQHPHIGLSTLTYLLEGQIEHRDSTGARQVISPGDVGFMTAGEAVAHTERTPQRIRESGESYNLHGYQIWVAMPKDKEEMAPRFDFVKSSELPRWSEDGFDFLLVAGKGFGQEAPLPVHSDLFLVDVQSSDSDPDTVGFRTLQIKGQLDGEIGIIVTNGQIKTEDQTVDAGSMLISKTENECHIEIQNGSRILLFGGKAFPEKRHLYWNFVSHSREKIEEAKTKWAKKEFPKVEGDDTYIPLP